MREIANTRLFAERALYAAQQAPQLLRWEAELISMQLADQPGPRALIETSTSIASSLDRASRTAETLPDRIVAEREAILQAFEEQEGRLSALTRDIQQALQAGEQMSTALTATLSAFDALSKRFGVGEPRPVKTPSPDARPFDVLDYAQTAREVAAMAAELHELLTQLNTTLDSPALEAQIANLDAVSGRATEQVRGLLNHAFLLLAGLTLLVGVTVAVLRALVPRRPKDHTAMPPMA